MTTRHVTHGEFSIEREYDAPVERVFAAWANEAAKNEWFGAGDVEFTPVTNEYRLDFRVGGTELADGFLDDGRSFILNGIFGDIVENERIVQTYDVLIDHVRISVSLQTVEFFETDKGTKLITTEQGVFLDGRDTNESRQVGVRHMHDMLEKYLVAQKVAA
jgi:uncharacterized protein YndB with AHSA1/START domain